MDKPVEIKPEGLRRAATEFDDVADRAKQVLDRLKTASESKGEPWGHDHAGEKFADGEKGYKKNRDGTFSSLSSLVGVFQDNAKNLRDSAKTFEENEQAALRAREPLHPTRTSAVRRFTDGYRPALHDSIAAMPRSRLLRADFKPQNDATPVEPFQEPLRATDVAPRHAVRADGYTPEGEVTEPEPLRLPDRAPLDAVRVDRYTPEGEVTEPE
ncbi:WXG100 family type VII secretion target [Nocardia sp. NPDC057030]|uniref:WXG100 family type VII secretion target n=1 Tax=unclassified Nocardia TaxID=2637762 RepID=UPI003626F00D